MKTTNILFVTLQILLFLFLWGIYQGVEKVGIKPIFIIEILTLANVILWIIAEKRELKKTDNKNNYKTPKQ
ncbi:MAG: hypothetical protein QM499_01150 [Flavobacteriaceae bacterium]